MGFFKKSKLQKLEAEQKQEKIHTILLVDDEVDIIRTLSSTLEESYNLLHANDGQEALDLIQSMEHPERISLIMSDQRMPRLTGVEFFGKAVELIPKTMRIIMTGFVDIDAIIDAINRAKIYEFVVKPFDSRALTLTVKRAIEAFEMQQKMDEYLNTLEERVKMRTLELEQKNKELEEASLTDALTGLRNRRYIHSYLKNDIAISLRHYQHGASDRDPNLEPDLIFFLLDMDHFKLVNDTYGHSAGDMVLIQLSKLLVEVFREADCLVRWGGEEFLVVARFVCRKNAAVMAERIRAAVENHDFDIGEGRTIKKTCSLGFAIYPFLTEHPEQLSWSQVVDIADLALYAAKNTSRNASVGLIAEQEVGVEGLLQRILEDPATAIEKAECQVISSYPSSARIVWK